MIVWWFIRLMGCLYIGMIYCEENGPVLVSIDPEVEPERDVQVGLSIEDTPVQVVNSTNNFGGNEDLTTTLMTTRTQTAEPFACHECTNCKSKSDFVTRVCDTGITMCYKMDKRINNTSRIYRGCSTSKTHCTTSHDDPTNTYDSITCCTSHKCNQAIHFKPLFFLSITSLFTSFFIINNI